MFYNLSISIGGWILRSSWSKSRRWCLTFCQKDFWKFGIVHSHVKQCHPVVRDNLYWWGYRLYEKSSCPHHTQMFKYGARKSLFGCLLQCRRDISPRSGCGICLNAGQLLHITWMPCIIGLPATKLNLHP